MRHLAILLAAALLTSCHSTETLPPDPDETSAASKSPPTIRIHASTTGVDRDANGYRAEAHWGERFFSVEVSQDGTGSMMVPATNCDQFDGYCGYRVTLTGLAPNCDLEPTRDWWSTTRQVPVDSGQVKDVSFTVRCEPVINTRLPAGTRLAFVRDGRIHLVDSDGTNVTAVSEGPDDGSPAWSPDGQRIVFTRGNYPARDLYMMNADGSNLTRLTVGGYNEDPEFSPDGARIVFASGQGIHTMSALPGAGPSTPIVDRTGWEAQPAWSPSGDIVFVSDWFAYDFTADLFLTTPTGSPMTHLTSGFGDSGIQQYYHPAWSPDGSTLAVIQCQAAYATCDAAGITLIGADGTVHRRLRATNGSGPTWSPDGRTIAYSKSGLILCIRTDGNERGLIVADGHSPAWRPQG